jgi:hypothetical protein
MFARIEADAMLRSKIPGARWMGALIIYIQDRLLVIGNGQTQDVNLEIKRLLSHDKEMVLPNGIASSEEEMLLAFKKHPEMQPEIFRIFFRASMGISNTSPTINGFRISGNSNPVMSANANFSRIFLVPFKHDAIALWHPTANQWVMRHGRNTSIEIADRTAGLPFDVFVEWNGSSLILSFANWTSATARNSGSPITLLNGVPVQTGAPKRRLLGTVLPDSPTTGLWRPTGDGANGFATLGIWNMDNRIPIAVRHIESTDSWAYNTNVWRVARAASNFIQLVNGAYGQTYSDAAQLSLLGHSSQSLLGGGRWVSIGYGQIVNAGSATPIPQAQSAQVTATAIDNMPCSVIHTPNPGVGNYSWLEKGAALGTITWQGDNGGTGLQSGMTLLWPA